MLLGCGGSCGDAGGGAWRRDCQLTGMLSAGETTRPTVAAHACAGCRGGRAVVAERRCRVPGHIGSGWKVGLRGCPTCVALGVER